MKICTKCKVEKEFSNFYKQKSQKDGYNVWCKNCCKYYAESKKDYQKQYRFDNKENAKEYQKQYYLENKEELKKYYLDNKEEILKIKKQYRLNNKEKTKEYNKQYRLENKEELKKYHAQYNFNNKEYKKQWDLNNKGKLNKNRINRKLNDPLFKLSGNIRTRIYQSIKNQGYSKKSKTYDILGCSFEYFKKHLEQRFADGMNWNNYGEWHLDHIYPVSLAIDEEHLIKLNNYTNFQPLWAEDNRKKSNKIEILKNK